MSTVTVTPLTPAAAAQMVNCPQCWKVPGGPCWPWGSDLALCRCTGSIRSGSSRALAGARTGRIQADVRTEVRTCVLVCAGTG